MKTRTNTATALAVVLMLSFSLPALAAAPRTEGGVIANVVTVADVFSGVKDKDFAGYVLAPAPQNGETLTLGVSDLKRISDAFNLGWMPETGREQVVIRRATHEIDRFEIEAALREKATADMPDAKFELHLDNRAAEIQVPRESGTTLVVDGLRTDLARGTFSAILSALNAEGEPVVKTEVTGRIQVVLSVPVLKTGLRQGDVIGSGDISWVDMRAADVSANIVVDAEKLVGQTPRRGITALRPISAGDIQPPVMVKKGDLVTLTLQNGIIHLTMQGKALESGAAGDSVRVINTASNQTVEGIVTGAQSVDVPPPPQAVLASAF